MSDVLTFLGAVLSHWVTLTVTVLSFAILFWGKLIGKKVPIPLWVFRGFAVLLLFLAFYLTWVDQHNVAMKRRANLLSQLRGEYILSHDNLSPGILGGTEPLPDDWLQKRLKELGEDWSK